MRSLVWFLYTAKSRTIFSFSCFWIADLEAVSQYVALLLRIKALALQKRLLFVLFAGKNRRHLGCRNIMRSRGCAVQNKGISFYTDNHESDRKSKVGTFFLSVV